MLLQRGMMPDWVPRVPDDMLLILFGGLLVWSIMVLAPEGTRIIAFAIPRFRRATETIRRYYDQSIGVMHFGTKHGDMSVRMVYNDDTIDDINAWLVANDLKGPVSPEAVKTVLLGHGPTVRADLAPSKRDANRDR